MKTQLSNRIYKKITFIDNNDKKNKSKEVKLMKIIKFTTN
jgi:hypothetical protein